MLKRYARVICFSLATMGAIFFGGNAYSIGSGAIVGQPQLDGSATAGPALITSTAMTANVPAESSAQLSSAQPSVSSSGAIKQSPTSVNGQIVERDFFPNGEVLPK